ncbi:hypothetical protein DYBT9275_03608 [Dyadobacter sp. CECT 9275]|uniref:FecR family protein n=1 Tax=Dyadobacter helix TaxID=2822344 RepID=A0A916N5K2_9BACT|nr:FecR domain-containing protein [Dyadobacter sp. CECT 9275]CAG5005574.1 hypothetical protein DYBT9275_03608 [Dyadobacter sp. CECT 9275]
MRTPLSKHTLFEYLSGRANPLEKRMTEDWLRDPENKELFYQWLMEWETMAPQFVPDQEVAVKNLLERIRDEGPFIYPEILPPVQDAEEKKRGKLFRRFFWAAAVVLLMAGSGWWYQDTLMYRTYTTAFGKTTNIYLEDGSRVVLNSNSSLKVPRLGFYGAVRKVFLAGEAEFTVSHTVDDQHFIVKTSDKFQVEVLGTQFSVFARPRGTQVALKTGSVRIDYEQNALRKNLMMKPGDLAILDHSGGVQLEKQPDPKTFAAWKEQRYVFNGTPISEISAMVEENFGMKVRADPDVYGRKITGNFKTENAEDLLKTISEVLDLKVHHLTEDSIYISNY